MRKYFYCFVFILLLLCCTSTAYCDELSEEEQQAILDEIKAGTDRGADLSVVKSIYAGVLNSGWKAEHAAAFIVNGMRESSLNESAGESGGGGIGIWQWSFGRREQLQEFSKEQGDQSIQLKGYSIGNGGTQVAFLIKELESGSGWGGYAPTYWYNCAWDEIKSKAPDHNWDSKMSVDEFKAESNPTVLAMHFTAHFEVCRADIDIWNSGNKYADRMYELLTGIKPGEGTNKEMDEQIGTAMVASGIWDETQFVKWKVMVGNDTLEFDTILDMQEDDIYDVETWKMDLEKQKGDGILIKGGRWLSLLFGIIFEVWMMFMYLSYWFDRLNNFFDFSLLYVTSLGRLRISPDENECNFSVKTLAKGEVRTINHKKLVGVVLVGLSFGSLIISGMMFEWLHALVNLILSFVG